MLFNSLVFILLFLPVVWVVTLFLLKRGQTHRAKQFIVLSSLFFYAWWKIIYLPIILSSMVINFFLGNLLSSNPNRKKFYLVLGLIFNISLLGLFKYADFIISIHNDLFQNQINFMNWMLPLAISFFTFQQIAFLIDAYKGTTKKIKVWDYAFFIAFFPQLIAGPIVHHKEIFPQLQRHRFTSRMCAIGLFIFIIGLTKKVVVADSLSIWVNQAYSDVQSLSLFESWVASLSYTFQLYFDFSGYSDMAIGIALLFGINLPINFNSPYKSTSIQDFWRRWHITLGRFFNQYLYIPLGGNRKSELHTNRNLLIVFLLSGLWHGAGWTFIIWGALHGLAILIHRWWKKTGVQIQHQLAIFITFIFINFAWVFFRANSISDAWHVIKTMVIPSTSWNEFSFIHKENPLLNIGVIIQPDNPSLLSAVILLFGLLGIVWLYPNSMQQMQNFKPRTNRSVFIAVMIFLIVHMSMHATGASEFLYFNF